MSTLYCTYSVLDNNYRDWFALQVRSKAETQVCFALRQKGYEDFLPTYESEGRDKNVRIPLFPGYVFCRQTPAARGLIVTTPGVIRVLGHGGSPIAVDPEEMRSVHLIVISGVRTKPCSLTIGDLVRVEDGPLAGLSGVLTCVRGKRQVVISMHLMTRSIIVQIDAARVRLLRPALTPKHLVLHAQRAA